VSTFVDRAPAGCDVGVHLWALDAKRRQFASLEALLAELALRQKHAPTQLPHICITHFLLSSQCGLLAHAAHEALTEEDVSRRVDRLVEKVGAASAAERVRLLAEANETFSDLPSLCAHVLRAHEVGTALIKSKWCQRTFASKM
jgi:hypothetical protein